MFRSIILLLICFGCASALAAQPTLSFRADKTELDAGDDITATLAVSGAPAVYGVQVKIRFDPTALRILDADPRASGTQLVNGGFFDGAKMFTVRNDVDVKKGEAFFIVSHLYPMPSAKGDGNLVSFRVSALKPGDHRLALEGVRFGTDQGIAVDPKPAPDLVMHVSAKNTFLAEVAKPVETLPQPVDQEKNWLPYIAGGIGALLLFALAFWLGQRSRRA